MSPPVTLLEHPPLASFANAVLAAFNDLRLCAPLGIAHSVTKCLEKSLGVVVAESVGPYYSRIKLTVVEPSRTTEIRQGQPPRVQ